jgi:hypothetical protein
MTTEEIRYFAIERLDATIEKIKTLKPEQFNYNAYVTNEKDGCGTTCCIAGWYPVWFPESELTWAKTTANEWNKDTLLLICPECTIKTETFQRNSYIIQRLSKYHHLAEFTIRSLFYGEGLSSKSGDDYILRSIPWGTDPEINHMLYRFETVRALLRIGTHDHLLIR